MKANSDKTPQLYIGLDFHKEKTSVAITDPGVKSVARRKEDSQSEANEGRCPPLPQLYCSACWFHEKYRLG
jgi:hypothetical protein